MRRLLAFLAIAALLLAGAAAASSHSVTRSSASPAWVTTAKQRLANLKTNAAALMSGYSRAKFGSEWEDVDLNGCDTRNDILARDLKEFVYKDGSACIVAKETLDDRYTGKTIAFVRGPMSGKVQIDHVVALAAAWRTGAKGWPAIRRLFYANDPLVLLAVDGPTNGSKSDSDAGEWLPPNVAYRCRYVAKQIAIKTKYELWITSPEQTAMSVTLASC